MDLPDFFIIGALIAVARWVIRSVKEPGIEPPDADGKPRPPRSVKPGQKTVGVKVPATSDPKRGAGARRPGVAPRHTDIPPAWYVVLDVPQDAPRSEIQSAAKRRIARALSGGDPAAVAHITRALGVGLRHKVLRSADALPRGKRDP
jgi:hypothetical protein